MSKITKSAKGMPCMVRLECCNGNNETTVFAHYRMAGTCGIGMKPSDIQGAYACSSCHDEIDRRTMNFEYDFVRKAHLEGVIRTQNYLIKKGLIKID